MAELTKEQLKELYKQKLANFTQTYKDRFAGDLPEGTPMLERIGRKLYGTDEAAEMAFGKALDAVNGGVGEDEAYSKIIDFYEKASKSPFSTEKTTLADLATKTADGTVKNSKLTMSPLGRTASAGLNYVGAHPLQTIGTAANTGIGLAGLFDNDKIAGQLIGTAAGAAIPAIAGMKLNPLIAYNVAMGAGNLGSLFDTLRAKKEQEVWNPDQNRPMPGVKY